MNTLEMNKNLLEKSLKNVDDKFRNNIISCYLEVKNRYAKSNYDTLFDSVGLSTGKLCESVLRFLQNELTGNFIAFGTHIPNFADEVSKLTRTSKSAGNESLRIIIPRSLLFLYTLRGKRGIGHVGGDIEANQIDISVSVKLCDWIICELIRIYHKLPIEEAQSIIDNLALKEIPMVWEVRGKKRILIDNLGYKDKTLLLLYSDNESGVLTEDLFSWIEYSKINLFKTNVLKQLHEDKYIEYDREEEIIVISPKGIMHVEENVLKLKK